MTITLDSNSPHPDTPAIALAVAKPTGSTTATGAATGVTSDRPSVARGATILTLTMFAANAGNYLVNVMLGRWLTPTEFSDATLMVTLMLVATAVAIALQLVASKLSTDAHHAATRWLGARALYLGIGFGLGLTFSSSALSDFFHTESSWPFVILGLGMPFYTMQSVGRGVLQGRFAFGLLGGSFGVEMLVRAVFSIGLVAAGFGVVGATTGLSLSFVATWLFVRPHVHMSWAPAEKDVLRTVGNISRPVGLLLFAQVVINNEDVLFAKRFLDPATAGRYGAVALIGRGVFFASWAVASAVFPAAAARTEPVGRTDRLLMTALAAVATIGAAAASGAYFLGNTALGTVFGEQYRGLSGPLAVYAVVTTLFAISNLFATYHLSTGNTTPSILLVVGSALQTALLFARHTSISQLVQSQCIAMALLTVGMTAYHFLAPAKQHPLRKVQLA